MSSASHAAPVSIETRRSIWFLNWAHALDHYVMLIFPTVVLGLEAVYGRPYGELIALGTASFIAFGVFSLPAGWLADRWSRRNMMALFYFGCGVSLLAAAFSPTLIVLAGALCLLGMFAAIYHPVGMAMLWPELHDQNGARLDMGVEIRVGQLQHAHGLPSSWSPGHEQRRVRHSTCQDAR